MARANPEIDPDNRSSDIDDELPISETHPPDVPWPRPQGRRRSLPWLVTCAVVLGGLAWLNGPGLRWLVPAVTARLVKQTGAQIEFTLAGSLTGGLVVHHLRLTGYPSLESLTIQQVTPTYRVQDLLRGHFGGISIDGLAAALRLGAPHTATTRPFELARWSSTLRDVRARIIPLAMELNHISLTMTRDDQPMMVVAPSHLDHKAGDSSFQLELGPITDATGRHWPSQQSHLLWTADGLSIPQIDPMPGISVRDLVLRLPASGEPSAEAAIHIDDALLVATASPGLNALSVDLREGRLQCAPTAARFGLILPATATVTSLALHVNGLWPDAHSATGSARIRLENIVAEDWKIPELNLAVELDPATATLAAQGRILGAGVSVHAQAPITRHHGTLEPGHLRGDFEVTDVEHIAADLATHTRRIDPASDVPPATAKGEFSVTWHDRRPTAADVSLLVQPTDPRTASPVNLRVHWQPNHPLAAQLAVDGLHATAAYNLADSTYQATSEWSNFTSTRIDRWLQILRAAPTSEFTLTGSWHGSGDLNHGEHHGTLALDQATWHRQNLPPITADGVIDYSWPDEFTTTHLRLQTHDQTVAGDAHLSHGILDLTALRWLDGSNEIADGSARLPVPDDLTHWRAFLARDPRPLAVALNSKVLPMALLNDWLPATAALDPRSTGCIHLQVAGTYAQPELTAVLDTRALRPLTQPSLPPANVLVTLAGRDGQLSVNGQASTPGFPAAVMTASLPFRPAAWAESPALLPTEPLTAHLDLPRLDLARLATWLPACRKTTGTLTGKIEVAGMLGKPLATGRLDLTGGGIELRDDRHPALTDITASIDLSQDRITLKALHATVAGGTLRGTGALKIQAGMPAAMDFRLTGNHLPVLRNDSLILRANTELRLAGPWQHATLTGTVGLVDGLFYRDIELLPIGSPFTTPSAAALPKIDAPPNLAATLPAPISHWDLNVLVRTQAPFLIRGNFATGRIDGQVRVGGTFGQPSPAGEVRLSEFRAALPFSTLHVRAGTARFTPGSGFDPLLEIRGTAEPRPYQVNLYVYGRASNPQLVLTSNPPLPDNEIMTLLATGTTTTGLENPQAASTRALQLLAEELRRGRFAVGKRLRPLLKLLDQVDFSLAETDPYSSESFSTATLALSDRWLISAGMDAQGDSRVLAIWRITFH